MKNNTELQTDVMDVPRWEPSVKTAGTRVSAKDRWVTLEGAVNWQYQRKAAEETVHHMGGVREISNEILVKPSVEKLDRSRRPSDLMTPVVRNVLREIRSMKGVLGRFANALDFANLEQSAVASLTKIECLIVEGKIEPLAKVRHSVESALLPHGDRELRIGVFPTAANPFHWGHLLGGLIVMERFLLDKVIFVIAGRDSRKPEMAPEDVRHSMAKGVLELFHPLFEYSSIALGTVASGEENLFKILGMNPARAIHAFYIAGGDHYHRFHPVTGRPDTIQKLEEGMTSKLYGFDEQLHRVSAVFLRREGGEGDIPTSLDVRRVGWLPVQTSSTEIRRALEDCRWRKLYTLPFAELVSICDNKLYRVRACREVGLRERR